MVVNFYTTSNDPKDVNKSLTLLYSRECEVKGANNILSPSLVVRDVGNANYCQIMGSPYNGRYYFISPKNAASNGIVTLELHEDLLMSLKSQFLQCTGVIARQENSANLYITDNEFPVENRNKVYFKEFPRGFDSGLSYYLTIGG